MLLKAKQVSASTTCNLIDIPFLNRYNSPADSSLFIMFTFAYLFLPMRYNNQMNYAVITALLSMYAIDSITRVGNSCTTTGGAVLGGLVGFVFGSLWYTMFHVVGADNLLYILKKWRAMLLDVKDLQNKHLNVLFTKVVS